MTDIVLKDVDDTLAERIRRVADKRGWTVPKALLQLLEQGLYVFEDGGKLRFETTEEDALQAAISALESVANDGGYAMIGKVDPGADQPSGDPGKRSG